MEKDIREKLLNYFKPYNEEFGFPLKEFIHTDCPHYWKYSKENEK